MCVFVRDKETGGCWWARGDYFTVCVWTCARGWFMSHGQTRACRAGGLHHGRPNARGCDRSERGGGGGDAYIHPEATMEEGKSPHGQSRGGLAPPLLAKWTRALTRDIKDWGFAISPTGHPSRPSSREFQLWNKVTPAFRRRAFPFLHGQTGPHDALGQAGDLPVTAARIFMQPG